MPSLIFLKMMENGRNTEKASEIFPLGNEAVEFSYAFLIVNNQILTALHSMLGLDHSALVEMLYIMVFKGTQILSQRFI